MMPWNVLPSERADAASLLVGKRPAVLPIRSGVSAAAVVHLNGNSEEKVSKRSPSPQKTDIEYYSIRLTKGYEVF